MFKEKHVFAGNNSSKGFYSYFDYIIEPNDAKRIYILKGGPGVGKSSFMKKFGSKMASQGYGVEYIHCSSDESSLDGVLIPELKVAFIDGTAPHIVDPKLPGAVDEIVNLGIYINSKEIEKHKAQIIEINKRISQLYKSAYRYLESANLMSEEINSIYDHFTDNTKFLALCDEVINKLFPKEGTRSKPGSVRKMFTEAYTANGYIKYTDSLCSSLKTWAIIGENSNCTSKFLDRVVDEALKRGFYVECFYKPLTPDKLQHIIIPDLNVMLKTAENQLSCNYDEIINLHEIMDLENLKAYISDIENNLHLYDLLIKNALDKLSQTKKHHDLLEIFYVNNMDFKGVDQCYENISSQYS